jgi:outer membrane protein OmpA-like peptidoglycan-associated protein
VITRANRRLYVHLDFLELSEQEAAEQRAASVPDARTLLQRLNEDGLVTIPGLVFDEQDLLTEDQGLQLLVDALNEDDQTHIYIVGHLQAESSLDEQISRSLSRAQVIQQRLISAGIEQGRLQAQGVGPLAPFCRTGPCRQRIEIVVRP